MTANVDVREAAIPGAVNLAFFGGKVRLLGFGKYYSNTHGVLEKQDWSLRAFNDVSETGRPRSHSIMRYLPKIARDHGLGKLLYAPSPRLFNAAMCRESVVMHKRISISSDEYHDTVWLLRGADADGILLSRGHTYVVSPAGCPAVALWHEEKKLFAAIHAGRASVINEPALENTSDGRPHDSVIDNALDFLGCLTDRKAAEGIHAVIAFPIPAEDFTHPFDHPVYGKKNQMRSIMISTKWGIDCTPGLEDPDLAMEGRIDLDMVIRMQLCLRGVSSENIQTIPLPPEWYTTRGQAEDKDKRNLVIMQHL